MNQLERQAVRDWKHGAAQHDYRRCDGCDRQRWTVRKRNSRHRLCLGCFTERQR